MEEYKKYKLVSKVYFLTGGKKYKHLESAFKKMTDIEARSFMMLFNDISTKIKSLEKGKRRLY